MTLYQVKMVLTGENTLERQIVEFNVYEQGDSSYTCSREGSIGVYTVQHSALDKKQHHGYGYCFYTKDKSKLKDYGKILDDWMRGELESKIKRLTKFQAQLDTPWGDVKAKESKSKKSEKSNDDDI
jgi:hypothetical protein